MDNKFGDGIGDNVTNQRTYCETTNHLIRSIRGFVSKFVGSYTERGARGFTLLELLVSVGMFVTITTLVVFNFRAGEQSDVLRLAAEDMASNLRAVSVMSQTGKRVLLCVPGSAAARSDATAYKICDPSDDTACGPELSCLSQVPQGGYGVHMVAENIIGFADGNDTHRYEPGEEISTFIVRIHRDVVIEEVQPIDPLQGALDVVFRPPTPTIFINGAEEEASAEFVLHHAKSDQRKTVVVRRISGRIEVESR